MSAINPNSIAQLAASGIAASLVAGTLIAALAGGVLVTARRLASETRFLVSFGAMLAIVSTALAAVSGSPSSGLGSVHTALVVPGSWAVYASATWIVIAGFLLVRVGIGILHVWRVRESCRPLDPIAFGLEVQDVLKRGTSRRISLCTSELVHIPNAIGFFRPAVVVPQWLLVDTPAAELNQLILHEVAHLRRWDDWTNLLQKIVKALFFFHPAVWWIESRISLEREMACDDAVIATTANPRAYAECLTHLAEKSFMRRGLALAHAALGRVHQTSVRVAEILRGNRPPASRRSTYAAVSVVAGIAVACGVVVSRAPRLVVFAPEQPQIAVVHSVTSPQMGVSRQSVRVANPSVSRPGAASSTKPATRATEAVLKTRNAPARVEPERAENSSAQQIGSVLQARLDASSIKSAPAIEDVYFVMESREYLPSGVMLYRTSVWRIVLTPTADNPATRVPRKEI